MRIGPAETRRGDDFLVIDALVAVAGLVLMRDVPFARHRTQLDDRLACSTSEEELADG